MLLWVLVLLALETRTAIQKAVTDYEKTLAAPGVWTEVTPRYIEIRSLRFPERGVAWVEAVESQYGSLIVKRSVPAVIVLRKLGSRWHVQFYRTAASATMIP